MAVLLGILTILLLEVIHCYDNICERTTCTATQSSVREGLSADKVIDGNTKQDYKSCSHTAVNATSEAWVMVDLRKEYKLQKVVIVYRNQDEQVKLVRRNRSRELSFTKQAYEWRPYRFRHYRLEVSNSSGTQQWTECYKDCTPNFRIPSSIQNVTCGRTARYLRIITNYDAPEDDEFSESGPVLEVCEIQIYGCEIGYYGPNCSPCGGCKHCDILTGCSINQATESSKNSEFSSVSYGVITMLIISIFVNIFFIVWKVRQKIYLRQDSKKASTRDANTNIYDRIEDNASYQELRQLSQLSQYDELKK